MSLINQAKSDLYISINEVKEEFFSGRKKYEESLYERASRAEINSERTAEDLQNFKLQMEDIKRITTKLEKESMDYAKSI